MLGCPDEAIRGATTSSTYQDSTATFDGFGRMASSHKPEQRDSSDDPTYTTYSYNPDDSIKTVTDARGAVTTYSYGHADDTGSTDILPTTNNIFAT